VGILKGALLGKCWRGYYPIPKLFELLTITYESLKILGNYRFYLGFIEGGKSPMPKNGYL
jgi:hypothetical protein